MQAIKEKLNDMSEMRKAKAEAREEERAEKELAKSRVQVAHEVRMAKEAEAAMDLHVNKAAEKVMEFERKYSGQDGGAMAKDRHMENPNHGSGVGGPNNLMTVDPWVPGASVDMDGVMDPYVSRRTGSPPTHNNLL